MATFQIRFLKDVCNDTGHLRCILQRTIVVEAVDEDSATREARRLFCARERVGNWRDHADRLEVEQVTWCSDAPPTTFRSVSRSDALWERKSGAGDENRTHDIQLGKLSFYH